MNSTEPIVGCAAQRRACILTALTLIASFSLTAQIPLHAAAAYVASAQLAGAKMVYVDGRVLSMDGVPVVGATVSTHAMPAPGAITVVTDASGRYSLTVPVIRGELNLYVTAAGFGRETVTKFDVVDTATVDITVRPAFETQMSVEADVPMLTTTGTVGEIKLAPSQIAVLPSLGERDLFRAFQLLPGVSGSNETSSGLHVRGGTPDQNAILLDGFRVYHVDHLFGYFSAFNMDAIESVSLHKGGFAAKYGGAVSGIMDIEGRSGKAGEPSWSGGGSLLGYHGLYERPLGERGSLLVAFRRSFQGPLYNKILGLVNDRGVRPPRVGRPGGGGPPGGPGFSFNSEPASDFYDVNAKLTAKPTTKDGLSLSLYQGGDAVDNSRDLQLPADFLDQLKARGFNPAAQGFDTSNPSLNITDVRDTTNFGVGLIWTHRWNSRVQVRTNIGHSAFHDARERSVGGTNTQSPNAERDALSDLTFRIAVPVNLGVGHNIELGFENVTNDSSYRFQGGPPGAGGSGQTLDNLLDQRARGTQLAGYAQDEWLIKSRLFLSAGARLTRFDRTEETYIDPRLAVSLTVNSRLTLKGAVGTYHQFTNHITREDLLQGNREFWSVSDNSLVPVTHARDVVGGASVTRGSLLVDVEAFSKNTEGLTQFAPRLQGVSDSLDYTSFFYHGSATSRGMDVLVQKKFGRHTGWVSYTNNHVRTLFPGLQLSSYPADQDRPHEIKAVSVFDVRRWTISGTWVLASGRPYTAPTGTTTFSLPNGDTLERVVVGDKNGARLPVYNRLDLALNRRVAVGPTRQEALLNLTLFNAYNRRNVWYKEFNVIDGEVTENNIRLMGLTLNASFTIKF